MHSSRMRTGRSSTVCWSLLPGGGGSPPRWGGGDVSAPRGAVCSGGGGGWGGCLLWGKGQGGVSLLGGVCLLPGGLLRGVSASGGWGCLLPGGCPLQRGPLLGGVCSRGVVSQHALRQTPPVNRMTDRCKNITLATTSLRSVKKVNVYLLRVSNSCLSVVVEALNMIDTDVILSMSLSYR